jgi:hypothetical protein
VARASVPETTEAWTGLAGRFLLLHSTRRPFFLFFIFMLPALGVANILPLDTVFLVQILNFSTVVLAPSFSGHPYGN